MNDERSADPFIWVVIPAAGKGTRFGAGKPKQYLPLIDDQPVMARTLACFTGHPRIAGIIVAVAADDPHWSALAQATHPRVHRVAGGAERANSVLNALDYLASLTAADARDWVLVHDAARPCLSRALLDRLLDTLYYDAVGGILAVPVSDTVKQVTGNRITGTPDRRQLWLAQTPQMFRLATLRDALRDGLAANAMVTDEASAIERAGLAPRVVEGEARNLKITRADDLALARFYLAAESAAGAQP